MNKNSIWWLLLGMLFMALLGLAWNSLSAQQMGKSIFCNTTVTHGTLTLGGRCSSNEVMTGYDSQYIYCSHISVSCMDKSSDE